MLNQQFIMAWLTANNEIPEFVLRSKIWWSLSSKFGIYWKIINYFKVTVTTKYKPNQGKSSHVIIWQKKKVTPKSQNKESQLWLHILCKTKQFKTCYSCSCGKCFLCSAHKIHPVVESGDTTMKPNVVLRVHQRCSQVIKKKCNICDIWLSVIRK